MNEAKRKKEEYNNLEWLKEMLQEAKDNLHAIEELQKQYPNRFGLKISIDGWNRHIKELEQKIEKEGSEED